MFKIKRFRLFSCSILTISFIILMCSGCETGPEKLAPDPGEPVAYFPKMKVGDTWVIKNKMYLGEKPFISNLEVINVEKDGSFVLREERSDNKKYDLLYYNYKYLLIKKINISTGKNVNISDPPKKYYLFPLFVGKKWNDDRYTSESVEGVGYQYENSYKVLKYETVKLKAGSFKAFKIRRINTIITGTGGPWISYSWYSPKMKVGIKFDYSPAGYDLWAELLEYNLAK